MNEKNPEPKYRELNIHDFVNFSYLAHSILSQTGTSRTLIKGAHDYRVMACTLADSFMISLSEALLREAMESRKQNKGEVKV
jgi:hypothetical protein